MTAITSKVAGDRITSADINSLATAIQGAVSHSNHAIDGYLLDKGHSIAGIRIATEFDTAKHAGTDADPWSGAAIQAAINDLPSGRTEIGVVDIPAGVWLAGQRIDVPSYTMVVIRGRITVSPGATYNLFQNSDLVNGNSYLYFIGNGGILDGTGSSDSRAISVTASAGPSSDSNIVVRGLVIHDFNHATNQNATVFIQSSDRVWVEDNDIYNGRNAVEVATGELAFVCRNRIDNMSVIGILLQNGQKNTIVMDNTINGPTVAPENFGIELYLNQTGCIISNNYIRNCDNAIATRVNSNASNCVISDNVIEESAKGIYLQNSSKFSISDNWIQTTASATVSAAGIRLDNSPDCSMIGNWIRSGLNYCIDTRKAHRLTVVGNVLSGAAGWREEPANANDDRLIASNMCSNLSTTGAAFLAIRGNRNSIVANRVFASTAGIHGIIISQGKDNFVSGNRVNVTGTAFSISTGSTNTIVVENWISGSPALSDSGSGTVKKRNTGYKTENGGDSSISHGTSISHGLATTPNRIIVTGQSRSARHLQVRSKSASTFTVGLWNTAGSAMSESNSDRAFWYAEV